MSKAKSPPATDRVLLVQEGQIHFTLNREPPQNSARILRVADELVGYLERCLGQRVPQYEANYPVVLALVCDARLPLKREEFEIIADPARVELRARTVQAMHHAVYHFLETACGIRWLWPGPSGEVVPPCRNLDWPVGTIRQEPAFVWRSMHGGGAVYGQRGGQDIVTGQHAVLRLPLAYLDDYEVWCRRNRLGGLRTACGHRWAEIAPPEVYGKSHPEYYALVDGKRDAEPFDGKHHNQPCLSNPDVIRLMADYAIARFESEPDLDVCSLALNDGGGSCACEACRRIDEAAGVADLKGVPNPAGTLESSKKYLNRPSITDRLAWHMQQVSARVAERFPDKLLLTLIYGDCRRPPQHHRFPDNVIAQYCVMGAMFWAEPQRDMAFDHLHELAGCTKHLGVYEYYAHGSWIEQHRLFPELIASTMPAFYKAGVRYMFLGQSHGFANNGLNLYLAARFLWDPAASLDALVEDYCRSGFGAAAPTVRTYFNAFAERWRETKSGTTLPPAKMLRLSLTHLYDVPFLQARQEELETARLQAEADPTALDRIEFLARGLDYTRLHGDALRATEKAYALAGPEGEATAPVSSELRAAAHQAVTAWSAYWGFVRAYGARHIFDDWRVHYHPGPYGADDPILQQLETWAAVK